MSHQCYIIYASFFFVQRPPTPITLYQSTPITISRHPRVMYVSFYAPYLGSYSSKKYKLFVTHIDTKLIFNGELVKRNTAKAILLVRNFKKWLAEHPKEAVEEDGVTPITVNV